jgi:hypothetical protein
LLWKWSTNSRLSIYVQWLSTRSPLWYFLVKKTLLSKSVMTLISSQQLVPWQEKQQREKLLTGQPDFLLLLVLLEASDVGVLSIFYFVTS